MTTDARHPDDERLRDDLAAYTLGALGPDEAAEVERHVAECGSCAAQLRWLTPAIDLLPAAVPQRTPPDALRDRLMETVRAEATTTAAAAPARERRGPRIDWRSFMLRPATGLAAVALLAGGVGVGYAVRGEDEPAGPDRVGTEALIANVSATLELHGDSGTLHVNQMPEIGPDQVYEVWVQRGGVMEPASLFVLNKNGAALAAVPGLEGAEAIAVTVEPRGGSQSPTSDPLLQAELS